MQHLDSLSDVAVGQADDLLLLNRPNGLNQIVHCLASEESSACIDWANM
jgi:hypothetical protein